MTGPAHSQVCRDAADVIAELAHTLAPGGQFRTGALELAGELRTVARTIDARTQLDAARAARDARRPRRPGSDTSGAAQDRTEAGNGRKGNIRPGSRSHQALGTFVRGFARLELTDAEVAAALALPRNEAAKRCSELRGYGYLAATTKVRERSRLSAITDTGYAHLRSLDLKLAGRLDPLADLRRP